MKKLLLQLGELYKRTKLNEDEIKQIRSTLRLQGVDLRRMNPKGMTSQELFGDFD